MSTQRASIIKGPALVTRNSVQYYTKGDIGVTMDIETDEIITSLHGKRDERAFNRSVKINFQPTEISESALTEMYYPLALLPGQSLFGDSDIPLYIQTQAGKLVTYPASAITTMPPLRLRAKGDALDSMGFTCVQADNTDWSDDGCMGVVTDSTWTDPGTFDVRRILQQAYTASWADSGVWSSFSSVDGFSIDFTLDTQNFESDLEGLIDIWFVKSDVMCKFRPLGAGGNPIREADILAAMAIQGTTGGVQNYRGQSLRTKGNNHDLTLVGRAAAGQSPKQLLTAVINNGAMKSSGYVFGTQALRAGEIGIVATREITGTPGDLISLTLS